MEMTLDLKKTPFSLNHTLSCGQTFRWKKRGDWWTGVVGQNAMKLRQKEGTLQFHTSSKRIGSDFLWQYFRLDDDLLNIYSDIMKDEHVRDAIDRFYGLRLIRQEPWECLISYLCATNKNIPAIKQMIAYLCKRFGQTIRFEHEKFFGFPEPETLASSSLPELQLCKVGYRARLIRETARIIARGDLDLEGLKGVPYEKAKKELMMLPGVGPKVADCVLLFSLDKLEAFPIDVWMKRVVLEYYSKHFKPEFAAKVQSKKGLSTSEYRIIYASGRAHFGDSLGYAQEYLYHDKRCASG